MRKSYQDREPERQKQIDDVFAFLAWLEANPDVPIPSCFCDLSVRIDRDELPEAMAITGRTETQIHGHGEYRHEHVDLRMGRVTYSFWTEAEQPTPRVWEVQDA